MFKRKNLREVSYQWGGATSFLFAGVHATHDLVISLPTAMIALIRAGLGLNYLQSGLVITALGITSGFSQLLGGWLGDRVSRHIGVATGLGGVGLAILAVGLTNSYYPMLIVLILLGIMAGIYHPSGNSLLSDYYEPARRGKVLGLHLTGGTIGLTLAPVLGGLIGDMLGWRFSLILLGIPAMIAALVILYWFRQAERVKRIQRMTQTSPARDGTAVKPANRWVSIGRALRPVAALVTLTFLSQFLGLSARNFIPLYWVDKHGISAADATMWGGMFWGGGLAGSVLGGWLADKWGRKKAMILGIVATGPSLYLLTMLPFNAALIVIFALFGLFMNITRASFQTLLMDITPIQFRATMVALYYGTSSEANSLAAPVVGWLMNMFGIINIFWGIALITVALSVITLLLTKRVEFRTDQSA